MRARKSALSPPNGDTNVAISSKVIRILLSTILILGGIILLLIPYSGIVGDIFSKIGLALVVAGTVSLFHEVVLKQFETDETTARFTGKVEEILRENPLYVSGIRLLSPMRRGLDQYYYWAISTEPQQIYFAGRSVLHRVELDLQGRGVGPVEEVLARRLSHGARIHIMFLNPQSSLVPRLADEEGQSREDFVSDLAATIGICGRVYNKIKNGQFPPGAELHITMYDEIPYFAYHAVDDDVILGFYFTAILGHATAAYEILDVQTKEFFSKHFDALFARSETMVHLAKRDGKAIINHDLVSRTESFLQETLGKDLAESLLRGDKISKEAA